MADRITPETTGRHDLYARYVDFGDGTFGKVLIGRNYVWNPVTLVWEKMTQPT